MERDYSVLFFEDYFDLMLTISASFVSNPMSDTASPLRRFIRVITVKKTKVIRKEKVKIDKGEDGSTGGSEKSISPINMLIVLTTDVHGLLK